TEGRGRVQEAGFRAQELQRAESREQKAGTACKAVIPALPRHPRASGDPSSGCVTWVPACAGMTPGMVPASRGDDAWNGPRLRGDDCPLEVFAAPCPLPPGSTRTLNPAS